MCLCIFLGIFVKLRVRMYYTGHLSVIDIVPFVLVVSSSQLSVKALESPIKNSSCSIKQQRLQLARYLMNINYHTWSFQESGIKAICQENVYCLPSPLCILFALNMQFLDLFYTLLLYVTLFFRAAIKQISWLALIKGQNHNSLKW